MRLMPYYVETGHSHPLIARLYEELYQVDYKTFFWI
jgi:hypothetical protein